MKRHSAILVSLAVGLVGCTDTIDSVTLEYRNANNEMIDAMMMVTSEARAAEMHARVFKSAFNRYEAIDKRLETVKRNSNSKKEFAKNVLESDGVHMYLTELEINSQRFCLEILRMRNLAKQIIEHERQTKGDDEVNFAQICPKLNEMIGARSFEVLREQLANPRLVDMMNEFQSPWVYKWQNEEEYANLFKVFEQKRKTFGVKDEKFLVW